MKIAVGGMIVVILSAAVKSQNRELALVLSLCAGAVFLLSGMQMFRIFSEYLLRLQEKIELERAFFAPLMKVCGIGVLAQLSASFCTEAGESAIAKIVELCGGVAAVCALMPMVDAAMEMVEGLLGG